jgi:hypothetical protein
MSEGGGFHTMPNGRVMLNSAHYAGGGGVDNANFRKILSQAKKEILSDIKNGTISGPIDNFEDLHDYVDANCYGGLCEMSYEISENYEVENKLFDELDKWFPQDIYKWEYKEFNKPSGASKGKSQSKAQELLIMNY